MGHLADLRPALTSFVGKYYGPGVRDAVDFINANGGVAGTPIDMETVDYAYKIPDAIANYKRWKGKACMVALQGWGTGDTEALYRFRRRGQGTGMVGLLFRTSDRSDRKEPGHQKPAPYNFFYGPSYTDACRAMVQWAAWRCQGEGLLPSRNTFTPGDNHPYPNAPKEASAARSPGRLGF